jgi:hypothetical protein
MLWEVDVHLLDPDADHAARAVVAGAAELGIGGCTKSRTAASHESRREFWQRHASTSPNKVPSSNGPRSVSHRNLSVSQKKWQAPRRPQAR